MEPRGLVKTGDFAQICGTTRHTLIHYDRIGILKPRKVTESGYRYYGADEFLRFETIRALVDSGFSLEEVGALLASRSPLALEEAVSVQLAALHEKMERLRKSALKLEEIARQAKRASEASSDVRFERRADMTCLPAPLDDFLADDSRALKDAMLRSRSLLDRMSETSPELAFAPICFAVDLKGNWAEEPSYAEAFYVLPEGMEKPSGVENTRLDGGLFACTDYVGPYSGVHVARKLLCDAVEKSRRTPVSPIFELNALSLLDVDFKQDSPYRCTLLMRVQ